SEEQRLEHGTRLQPPPRRPEDLLHAAADRPHDHAVAGQGQPAEEPCTQNHPDLQGRLTTGRDFVGADPNNHQPDDDPTDHYGHGTMTSGIIGAIMNILRDRAMRW
ncbi:MAG TPA: S8 family serine peptidase, partial [Planctomycetota bacterium]|nr:S8 family serine peptidase [Planctomycetota bacterium]